MYVPPEQKRRGEPQRCPCDISIRVEVINGERVLESHCSVHNTTWITTGLDRGRQVCPKGREEL